MLKFKVGDILFRKAGVSSNKLRCIEIVARSELHRDYAVKGLDSRLAVNNLTRGATAKYVELYYDKATNYNVIWYLICA